MDLMSVREGNPISRQRYDTFYYLPDAFFSAVRLFFSFIIIIPSLMMLHIHLVRIYDDEMCCDVPYKYFGFRANTSETECNQKAVRGCLTLQ